ncbi:hypothetical protein NADFUDRAFT_49710 [Nadsonia fulvescens var. elongata DSM 6958]|uniref:Cyclin-like protein n=1 Tax=Nadsonia fulvescens var. elongata DSM 6958 TaxID=857566 RepID=A0A1E3PPB4_9ASCO|nr:hypothetical protein NADFUDRAFT_49710 [Nadsonia fulvescens var. elongata DSM 6958]
MPSVPYYHHLGHASNDYVGTMQPNYPMPAMSMSSSSSQYLQGRNDRDLRNLNGGYSYPVSVPMPINHMSNGHSLPPPPPGYMNDMAVGFMPPANGGLPFNNGLDHLTQKMAYGNYNHNNSVAALPSYYNHGMLAPPPPPPAVVQQQQQQQQHQQQQHENNHYDNNNGDNVAGGVTANLDYQIEEMAEFVSVMSQGIMLPGTSVVANSHVSNKFKKFISQVLSATRLPKATVVLSLVYLSKRFALDDLKNVEITNEMTYKLFVISLLLANKFHDDNTFTNRSWCQATGIPVGEITQMEASWLKAIKWSLNLSSVELKGWDKWNDCWEYWLVNKSNSFSSPNKFSTPNPVNLMSPPTSIVSSPSSPLSGRMAINNAPYPPKQITSSVRGSPSGMSYSASKWYPGNEENANNVNVNNQRSFVPRTPIIVGQQESSAFSSFFQQTFANNNDRSLPVGTYNQMNNSHLSNNGMGQRNNNLGPIHPSSVGFHNHGAFCSCNYCSYENGTTAGMAMNYNPAANYYQQQNLWHRSNSVVSAY